MAQRYYGGPAEFWEDWKEFTGTDTPVLVVRKPQLVLVARTFEPRTYQALEFLLDNNLPVKLLEVAFYVDEDGHRFLNVEWESEPETTIGEDSGVTSVGGGKTGTGLDFREVTLSDVTDMFGAPRDLVWTRPRKGERHEATLLNGGRIKLADGREFRSPSGAAMAAARVVSYDGWYAWRLVEGGATLDQLRRQIASAQEAQPAADEAAVNAQADAVTADESLGGLDT